MKTYVVTATRARKTFLEKMFGPQVVTYEYRGADEAAAIEDCKRVISANWWTSKFEFEVVGVQILQPHRGKKFSILDILFKRKTA